MPDLPINKQSAEEAAKEIKEFADELEQALPIIVPECERVVDMVAPLFDKFLGKLWNGKSFDSLVCMGHSAYIARALIQAGVPHDEVAKQAVAISQEIIKLSRE